MARKGILVSDPLVERTTRSQWVWEYFGLRKRENEDRKFQVEAMKNVLVSVLGLRVPVLNADGTPKDKELLTDDEKESFVPFIFLGGNHHLLKKYFEKFPESSEVPNPMDDAAFDEMSRRLAADDGDMIPLVDPLAGKNIGQMVRQKEHEALGIIEIDGPTSEVKLSEALPKPRVQSTVSFEEP